MQELLKALLGGGNQGQASGATGGGDPMAEILRSVLQGASGAGAGTRPAAPAGGRGIMDLLGAILGGAQAGGTVGAGATSGAINPLAQLLAERLGLPPQVAQTVVAFFLSKVMGQITGGGGQSADFRPTRATAGEVDLDHLLQDADDDKALKTHLSQTGMARELAQQTGLSQQQASQSLQALVKLLSEQRQTPTPVQPQKVDLKHLLDTWK